MAELRTLAHPFPPVYDQNSEILILGSFPSVKSVGEGYYYANPLNRFYAVISAIYGEDFVSADWQEKKMLLLKHHIALYDVIGRCTIIGSSDATIINAEPSDLLPILRKAKIRHIYCNGTKSFGLYQKYFQDISVPATMLPSTSPANARSRFDDLCIQWKRIFQAK